MEDKIEAINQLLSKNDNIKIAIDGPSGSGKGTVAYILKSKLNLTYVSMGNIFRSLACSIEADGISLEERDRLVSYIHNSDICYKDICGKKRLLFNGIDYSSEISSTEIADIASLIAADCIFHMEMTLLVRKLMDNQNILIEGRASGSHIFPEAKIKFYLDATLDTRVKRKLTFCKSENITREELKKKIEDRDERDKNRIYAPLILNDDYIYIDSSELSIDETVRRIVEKIYGRLFIKL